MKIIRSARVMFLGVVCTLNACSGQSKKEIQKQEMENIKSPDLDTVTFGAGCYWCVEAQFQLLVGVVSVTSGFSGGHVKNPSYHDVCTGSTGHAEVCQIVYDTTKLNFEDMLQAFWKSHDPTQMNRQGNDVAHNTVLLFFITV